MTNPELDEQGKQPVGKGEQTQKKGEKCQIEEQSAHTLEKFHGLTFLIVM
jgi:hypothetical protein